MPLDGREQRKSTSEDQEVDTNIGMMVIGCSESMRQVATMVRQVAAYPTTTVLIQGESGTGKEVIANTIHLLSGLPPMMFIDLNCAAIPEQLLETELFGVEAGAYTDARVSRDGYFARAHGGTLFLDEIGAMPLMLQAKLLRFLETRRFRPVGSTKEQHVKLRVISATNIDLKMAVKRQTFREDLFYRLEVITIPLPPLRERPEDIEPLIEFFLKKNMVENAKPLRISEPAMELLRRYHWPGNVRELRSAIMHGQIMCDGVEIRPEHLPEPLLKSASSATHRLQEVKERLSLPPEGIDMPQFLSDIEHKFVREALARSNHNQVRAAALLHLTRDQLRYRMGHLKPTSEA